MFYFYHQISFFHFRNQISSPQSLTKEAMPGSQINSLFKYSFILLVLIIWSVNPSQGRVSRGDSGSVGVAVSCLGMRRRLLRQRRVCNGFLSRVAAWVAAWLVCDGSLFSFLFSSVFACCFAPFGFFCWVPFFFSSYDFSLNINSFVLEAQNRTCGKITLWFSIMIYFFILHYEFYIIW